MTYSKRRPATLAVAFLAALVVLLPGTHPTGAHADARPAAGVATVEPGTAPFVLPSEFTDGDRVTALLLGLDRRPTEDPHGPNRTDIVQLATFDPETGQSAVVGFPRDLWVPIPGVGTNRINTAYTWGNLNGGVPGGLDLAKQTIESNFAVDVDFVIAVDFQPFIDIVDDLDGVQIDLPPALNDYHVSAPFTGHNVRLREGMQVATGEYTLAASRARPDSDFERLKRASHTLMGIFEKARSLSIFEASSIFLEHHDAVETDLSPKDWPALFQLALFVDTGGTEYFSAGDYASPYTTPDGAQVLLPNMAGIDAMLDQAFPGGRTS